MNTTEISGAILFRNYSGFGKTLRGIQRLFALESGGVLLARDNRSARRRGNLENKLARFVCGYGNVVRRKALLYRGYAVFKPDFGRVKGSGEKNSAVRREQFSEEFSVSLLL